MVMNFLITFKFKIFVIWVDRHEKVFSKGSE